MILLWCICYIIGIIKAVPSTSQTRRCLRDARNAFVNHVIEFEDYIKHMPLCITTVGWNGHTCPAASYGAPLRVNTNHWRRLNNFYSCINAFNDGGTISQRRHTVVLWSGRIGKQRAQLEASQSQNEIVRRWVTGIPAQWTDTQIPALRLAFRARATPPTDVDFMLADLICLWLIFNADIRYPINMYGSIDFVRNGVVNPGTQSLLNARVRKALIVNAYFWKVEILGILRLGRIRDRDPTVNVILKQYRSNGAPVGNSLTSGWATPRNIFGPQTSSIPVIVRPLPPNPGFTMYNIIGASNLRQLISGYNGIVPAARRLSVPLDKDQLSNIVRFVDWTKRRFTPATQTIGAAQTVTNPDINKPTEYVIEVNNIQIFLCLVLIILLIGCNCYICIALKQYNKNKKTKYQPVGYDTETDNTDAL